jgi:glycosyltransferase involved in cell wall biosynthesis
MSAYVLYEIHGVQNVIYGKNRFSQPLPPHNSIEETRNWKVPRLHRFSPEIPWHLLTRDYDLVVTAMLGAFPTLCTLAIANIIRRKPYIVIAENWYLRRNPLINWIYRRVARNAQTVVAQSTKAYRFLVEDLGASEDRVVKCVNSVIDLSHSRYDEALALRLRDDDSFKILCVGRFVEFKGQDLLIKAFQNIAPPDARLILVGDFGTPFGARCMALAGNDPRISFEGKASFAGVLAYCRECHLFVMANKFTDDPVESAESFGYAPLEAANFAMPLLLTTATGCADDAIIQGETGFQVPQGDVNALQEKLEFFLADRARAAKMGANAKAHLARLEREESLVDFKDALSNAVSVACPDSGGAHGPS